MKNNFFLLPQADDEATGELVEQSPFRQCKRTHYLQYGFLLSLTVLNVLFWLHTKAEPIQGRAPSDYARTSDLETIWTNFWWHTEYSPLNHTESDPLWDAILPQHGFVAIDREEAARNHWPASMYLPSDHSKGVYLLEAYHQLHCLRILRMTFWEAIEQRPFTYHPSSHMEHCFDTLRQSAVCNADSTPLYTFGDKTAGDGQLHKCRSWEQLRQYATENTACYRDTIEEVPLGDHFGYCDDGDDGIHTNLDSLHWRESS